MRVNNDAQCLRRGLRGSNAFRVTSMLLVSLFGVVWRCLALFGSIQLPTSNFQLQQIARSTASKATLLSDQTSVLAVSTRVHEAPPSSHKQVQQREHACCTHCSLTRSSAAASASASASAAASIELQVRQEERRREEERREKREERIERRGR